MKRKNQTLVTGRKIFIAGYLVKLRHTPIARIAFLKTLDRMQATVEIRTTL